MFAEVNRYLNQEIKNYSYEFRMFHLDGSLIWTLHRAVALFNEDGKAVRMIGTTTDTTQRKQIEESLRNAHIELEQRVQERTLELKIANENLKNDLIKIKEAEDELIIAKVKAEEGEQLKTSFLQNLSHEIRTPMNGIIGFAQLLDNPDLTDEKKNSYISIIVNSSNQLLNIVNDVLTISSLETKQEKINLKPVNINSILNDLLSIFRVHAAAQNLSLRLNHSLNNLEAEIIADGTKITQMLSNLLSNAIKFTEKGYVEFGYSNTTDEICFYVKDSGIGIAEENKKTIFNRFRQADLSANRKFGGAGLGLSISAGFADLLGTKIIVESKENEGSLFYFKIPYNKTLREKTRVEIDIESNNETILIAEDDEINFLILNEILSVMDYNIVHVKNGKEAFEKCKSCPLISLVFMDIRMPVLDGIEAAKQIKAIRPNLPIIAQSAYGLDSEKQRYNADVFDSYIVKPYQIEEIILEVRRFIKIA